MGSSEWWWQACGGGSAAVAIIPSRVLSLAAAPPTHHSDLGRGEERQPRLQRAGDRLAGVLHGRPAGREQAPKGGCGGGWLAGASGSCSDTAEALECSGWLGKLFYNCNAMNNHLSLCSRRRQRRWGCAGSGGGTGGSGSLQSAQPSALHRSAMPDHRSHLVARALGPQQPSKAEEQGSRLQAAAAPPSCSRVRAYTLMWTCRSHRPANRLLPSRAKERGAWEEPCLMI